MRKLLVLTAAAAISGLLVTAIPATSALAAHRHRRDPAVLTIGRLGGTAVRVGANLTGGLKKGTKASFLVTATKGVFCSSVSFTDKVTKNPRKPGTATEQLTKQTFSKCTVSFGLGATGVKGVVLLHLPYTTTISDGRGDPVTVFKTVARLTFSTGLGNIVCTYAAAKGRTSGHASNTGQSITFTKQPFKLVSGPLPGCFRTGTFSATFAPVRDSSVRGKPLVFVN